MLNSTGYRFKQCDINVMREMNKIEEAIGAASPSPGPAKTLLPLDNNEMNPAMVVGPYHLQRHDFMSIVFWISIMKPYLSIHFRIFEVLLKIIISLYFLNLPLLLYFVFWGMLASFTVHLLN